MLISPKTRSTFSGFTLIELLVVIFIIGILVGATLTIVPKVKRAVYGAQTSAQLSAIANAIQQYYNDFKAYPGPLPNNQICAGYDFTQTGPPSYLPFIYDHAGNVQSLTAYTPAPFANSAYVPTNTTLNNGYVTGAQNLVLGLLGGLELQTDNAGPGGTLELIGLNYNPSDIFSDGVTPSPKGASSLNFSNPRRMQPYIQVKAGDLSTPNTTYNDGTGGSFVDATGDTTVAHKRCPQDAMIPVFLDKYSDPLPILYFRTNVAGTAIVGYRNLPLPNTGPALTDPTVAGGPNLTAQYDLYQNLPYTKSRIGTIGDGSTGNFTFHGLNDKGLTASGNTPELLISSSTPPSPPVDSIDYVASGQYVPTNNGANAIAYFKDPTLNSSTYDGLTSNVHLGVARQKDGFLLISAGPDRLYGTHDDVVFPGPLQPAQ